jgi:ribosomal protein S18 acetylase RimI-like enzyme
MEIRPADDSDWIHLKRIRLRALTDSPDSFASNLADEASRPDDAWRAWAARTESSTSFLAMDGEEPCGMVAVLRSDEISGHADLISMWVDPAYRGRGVGRSLVAFVVEWCINHDVSELHLWVTESNSAALDLYRASGFAPTGNRQPLPSNPCLTEIEMSLPRRALSRRRLNEAKSLLRPTTH